MAEQLEMFPEIATRSIEARLRSVERTPEVMNHWMALCRSRFEARRPDIHLNPVVWNFQPWGHRLVLLRQSPEAVTKGGLHIPTSAQRAMAVGWVVSVGPDVNVPDPARQAGVVPYTNALDLVGQKVLIGQLVGRQLNFHSLERDYESDYLVVMCGDIWGVAEED